MSIGSSCTLRARCERYLICCLRLYCTFNLLIWFSASRVVAKFQFEAFIKEVITSFSFLKALLEAHQIEQSIARDPRIVLSDSVLRLVRQHANYYAFPEESPQNYHVLIDADGKPFINYLIGLIVENTTGNYILWDELKKHKRHIESGLVEYREEPGNWAKYYWLANYHNYFCNEYSDFDGYTKDYLISADLAKRQPARLIDTEPSK